MTLSSYPHTCLSVINYFCRAFAITMLTFLVSGVSSGQNNNPVVARVEQQDIRQQDLDELLASQIYALEQQMFALRMAALNNLIITKILESEAARQNLTIDELKNKWMSGPVTVDPAQVDDLYYKNRQAFALMNPDEAREKIRLDLETQIKLKRYRNQLESLRKKLPVEVVMSQPRLRITSTSTSSIKGPEDARVVITEFSDFQCPYCKEVQPNLAQILQRYPKQVRLEFKHLPLEIHPLAQTFARAAYCAGKQNAFWAFHDASFATSELSRERITDLVRLLKLDEDSFGDCLTSQESQTAISRDVQEARRLGIEGTPTFLINGKLFQGALSFDDFDKAILSEIGSSPVKTSTSPK